MQNTYQWNPKGRLHMNTSNTNTDQGERYEEKEKDAAANLSSKEKKGFWKKYTERLKDTKCSRTSQDCE